MMKRLMSMGLAAAFLLAGCSSTQQPNDAAAAQRTALAEFIAPSGKIAVEFDTKGNWLSLTAVATAAVTGTSQEAREQAASVASLRARRNIAEFMSAEINSRRSVSVITRTLQKASRSSASVNSPQPVTLSREELNSLDAELSGQMATAANQSDDASQIATVVREQITQNASAVLRGLTQKGQEYDRDMNVVRVELQVDRRLIEAASQMRRDMMRR